MRHQRRGGTIDNFDYYAVKEQDKSFTSDPDEAKDEVKLLPHNHTLYLGPRFNNCCRTSISSDSYRTTLNATKNRFRIYPCRDMTLAEWIFCLGELDILNPFCIF